MAIEFSTKIKSYIGILFVLGFAAANLFFHLGKFGLFEPFETNRAERVAGLQNGEDAPVFPLRLEERLAARFASSTNASEFALRLPSAIFALASLVLLYFFVASAAGPGLGAMSALMLCGSSFFWLHGRQLTGAMPDAAAEIAALGGGMLAVLSPSDKGRITGMIAAGLGIALSVAFRGLLSGAVPPLLAVSFAALSSGLFSKARDDKARRVLIVGAAALGATAAFVYAGTVLFSSADLPLITGRETDAILSKHTFEFAFEQIVYGFFPLVALVPIAVVPIFRSDEGESEGRAFLRIFAVYALLFDYAAQVVSLKVNGMRFSPSALPMATLIALAVDDLVSAESPRRLDVFISAALLAVLIRDFAQNNQTLYYAYGVLDLAVPKDDIKPVIAAGLCSIPTALLIVFGFLPKRLRVRPVSLALSALAPLCFAVFLTFFLVPDAAAHLSSKQGVMAAEKYRKDDEPLAVLGKGIVAKKAKKLASVKELAEWLSGSRRVLALLPPKDLPALDRAVRERTGHQVFVLERTGDRFVLAVSKLEKGEANVSPLQGVVQSTPFDPPPPNAKEINFDDSVTLLGWRLEGEGDTHRLQRGQDLIFTSYWRVDGRIPGDYKMFMHIDGPGGRMHGDHPMFNGQFPTSTWQKGDYIKEEYRMKVPLYQSKGNYTVHIGLYNKGGRLRIKDVPEAVENSLPIGDTVLE